MANFIETELEDSSKHESQQQQSLKVSTLALRLNFFFLLKLIHSNSHTLGSIPAQSRANKQH